MTGVLSDVEVIDARDRIVLPGLVDTHRHLRAVRRAGRFVDLDVTSVLARATASHDFLLGAARDGGWVASGGA